ncbi:hypothetical protein GUITHDRAFT_147764 [Guillardia theta CCMP2712]|uniref:Uncharacterized protein n=1 Tax=Guillardia theta (strain CCMP2712) TaxID=905079 RepID=L1IBJ9_GUITC|nr:hypothetical protein GUITHDRAFT_147764 [Guillardia theta CCMP2712]EKX33636.1 hypothetical protein GUITHDRAFT_147764 [Guillardia theta CCMP2712]|eukprot:XP_005820616.1 hypothetical protein GUITHDRAFT_147764 [Guillardia theta CCMP2712]
MQEDKEKDLFQRFTKLFLVGENLRDMMVYMCNTCTSDVQDPITHTICIFLSTPVRISITKIGLAPFQGFNTAIFPFFCMREEQKHLLLEILQFMQENSRATLSTQMGGGGMATLKPDGQRIYLDTSEVIFQFFQATKESERTGMKAHVRDKVCNIILQRVCSAVHIPRRTLNEIMERAREL